MSTNRDPKISQFLDELIQLVLGGTGEMRTDIRHDGIVAFQGGGPQELDAFAARCRQAAEVAEQFAAHLRHSGTAGSVNGAGQTD